MQQLFDNGTTEDDPNLYVAACSSFNEGEKRLAAAHLAELFGSTVNARSIAKAQIVAAMNCFSEADQAMLTVLVGQPITQAQALAQAQ